MKDEKDNSNLGEDLSNEDFVEMQRESFYKENVQPWESKLKKTFIISLIFLVSFFISNYIKSTPEYITLSLGVISLFYTVRVLGRYYGVTIFHKQLNDLEEAQINLKESFDSIELSEEDK